MEKKETALLRTIRQMLVTPDNGENQDPSDDKAEDQGAEISKPDDGQGDAVIDDNSDKG